MRVSGQLNRELRGVYYQSGDIITTAIISPHLDFEMGNVFNLFLRVDISDKEIDVPIMGRRKVEGHIYDNIVGASKVKEVAITLFNNSTPQVKSTTSSIFRVFNTLNSSNRLFKVETKKGAVYYGGNGYILDKEYNLLLLLTLHGDRNSDGFLTYKTGRIYVNPKVFISDGLVEKGIVKDVIPAFITEGIRIPESSYPYILQNISTHSLDESGTLVHTSSKAEIVIADVTDKFIVKPKKPTPSTFSSEAANDYLLEHIDDIVRISCNEI